MTRLVGMRRLWLSLAAGVLGLALSAGSATAQGSGVIRGVVSDAEGAGNLAGATVTLVGTRMLTTTDNDGRYVLRGIAPGSWTIRVAMIGYSPMLRNVTLGANAEATADFEMRRSVVQLDEVVTTATGDQSRRAVANIVNTVRTDSIAKISAATTVDQLLAARVPGVTVLPSYGMTGGGMTIRIRGVNSISLSSDPLWVIDGVRMETRNFSAGGNRGNAGTLQLNPEDIESLDIIKGPSAAALYGTQASNGVVVVRTKRGKVGRTQWNAYTEYGTVEQPADWQDNYRSWGRSRNTTTGALGTSAIQCRISNQALGTCVIDSLTTFNPLSNPETTPFAKGNRQVFGLQASGGTEAVRFFASLEKEDERGPYEMPSAEIERITTTRGTAPRENQIHPNSLDQINVRGNFTARLTSTLEANLNASYTRLHVQTPFNASYFQGIGTQSLLAPGFRTAFNGYSAQHLGDMMSMYMPDDESRYLISGNVNWNPLSWVNVRATAGDDRNFSRSMMFSYFGEGPNGGWGSGLVGQGGGKLVSMDNYRRTSADVVATANRSLTATLTSRTSIGGQYNTDEYKWSTADGYNLAPGASTTASGTVRSGSESFTEGKSLGFYVDQNFGWRDRVFLSGGARLDKSSAFGTGYPSVVYPRAGLSWVISEEDVFPDIGILDNLRLRFAWGRAGINPGATTAIQQLSASAVIINGQAQPTLRLSSLGNMEIRPEVVTETEFGFEFYLWDERLYLEGTFYNKKSKDGLGTIPLPPSLGAASSQTVNISGVQNKGFEAVADLNLIQSRPLNWNVRLSGSTLTNKVLDMTDDEGRELPQPWGSFRTTVGYPISGIWVNPIRSFNDANGDGILVDTEIVTAYSEEGCTVATAATGCGWEFLGQTLPKHDLSITNTLGFLDNKLNVMGMIDFRGGHYKSWRVERERCSGGNCRAVNDPTAPLADQAAAVASLSSRHNLTQAGYMKPADFWRLREVSVSYALPRALTRWFGASAGQLVVAGRNLLMISSKYPGLDSEAGSQAEEFNWQPPPLRYFITRLNLTF